MIVSERDARDPNAFEKTRHWSGARPAKTWKARNDLSRNPGLGLRLDTAAIPVVDLVDELVGVGLLHVEVGRQQPLLLHQHREAVPLLGEAFAIFVGVAKLVVGKAR